jgi:hypothetical protein
MKRLLLFALLGGLPLAVPAQTVPDNEVRIHGYRIVLPAKPHTMLLGDFDIYKGGYELSNGDVLVLYRRGHHLYGRLGEGEAKELVAAASNVFVALDRKLKVTLDRDNHGGFSGEVLMEAPASMALADADQVIRLATAP